MISEKQSETLEMIANLRKQVELLDSHRNVGLITAKQYAESLAHIVEKVESIEKEYGIEPPKYSAFDALFKESADEYNKMMSSFEALFS